MKSQLKTWLVASLIATAVAAAGCREDDKSKESAPPQQGAAPGVAGATQPAAAAPEHQRLPLGEKTVGGLKLVATMDAPVKPGGEGAFDLVITGGKPKAVRFWVGTENAEGSLKARAEEETTDNWHTHAEVPNPLPPGSQFWAEIEPATGQPFKVSFDLLK